jgi:hypothetical protein
MTGISGGMLREWRRARGWDVPEMARQLRRAAAPSPLPAHDALLRMIRRWEREGLRTERYELLYRKALAAAPHDGSPPAAVPEPAPAATEPWELADTLTRSSLSAAAVGFMEEAVTSLAARYPFTPPADLIPGVQSMLAAVNDALGHSQPLGIRARCVRLAGVLCGVAGQLADDRGRPDQSAAWFSAAGLAAAETGDQDMAAWALALRSIGCHFRGEYAESAVLLDRARAAASSCAPRRRAWLAALSARAQAAVASRRGITAGGSGVMRTVDDARDWLEAAGAPTGTDFFDGPRLAGMTGTTLLLLGDTQRARAHIGEALAGRAAGDVKGRALLTLDLAECMAAGRDVIPGVPASGRADLTEPRRQGAPYIAHSSGSRYSRRTRRSAASISRTSASTARLALRHWRRVGFSTPVMLCFSRRVQCRSSRLMATVSHHISRISRAAATVCGHIEA